METKNDETKSCVFYGFLNICSVDWNDTFVKLSDQCLSKIKDSSAKRQDGLQLNLESVQSKLYSYNGCYLHYTIFIFIPHSKILEAKSNYPKVCQCRKTSGQTKAMNTATFQLQRKLLALWEMCSLRPHPRNSSRWRKSILSRTVDRGEENKKFQRHHTAGMCSCTSDDGNLSLLLSGLQNLGFEKSTKNSCDI